MKISEILFKYFQINRQVNPNFIENKSINYPSSRYVSERNNIVSFREFKTDNFSLLISPSGEEYIHQHPHILPLLHKYRKEYEYKKKRNGQIRRHFKSGNEGDLFDVTNTEAESAVLVKEFKVPFTQKHQLMPIEKQKDFLQTTLVRAEHLQTFCREFMPDHIKVPNHYGFLLLPSNDGKNVENCALIMQKVNGISLDEFMISKKYKDNQIKFTIDNSLRSLVHHDYEHEIKKRLHPEVKQTDMRFSSHALAPDLFERNVIVDFSQPTQARPYTLWIIDQ